MSRTLAVHADFEGPLRDAPNSHSLSYPNYTKVYLKSVERQLSSVFGVGPFRAHRLMRGRPHADWQAANACMDKGVRIQPNLELFGFYISGAPRG